ncbi:hypothetical protein PRZ48_014431 [Zasmidium cellare]|uniref:Glutamine amidotransferase domain-containing protein n=1 Tax=Zasmidium cellare TaxID=395010 RepID=A0ABR0DY78_ZASCE|nr:hypothetical protein PRZ48_014431 [Zasmidium cellare]
MGSTTPTTPIRLAILECDTPIGRTKEKYGTYGNLFKELLTSGSKLYSQENPNTPTPELNITKYDVVNTETYPSPSAIDAVLLTGSRWNAYDDDPWIIKLVEFTKNVLEEGRVRVVGVCFGHQIVGRALGARVGRSEVGWEVSVVDVGLNPRGREVLGLEKLAIHQMHRDIVFNVPEGVELLGSSPRCEVQGMYAKGRLITVQGHPEFSEAIVSELLESRHEKGIFSDGEFEEGMGRVGREHDGVRVGRAFVRFLVEG